MFWNTVVSSLKEETRLLWSHDNIERWNLVCYCHSHSFSFRIRIKLYFKYLKKKKKKKKLNKQGDNIQPWRTPFPIWNQSVVTCPVLTVASWPAYRFLKRLGPLDDNNEEEEGQGIGGERKEKQEQDEQETVGVLYWKLQGSLVGSNRELKLFLNCTCRSWHLNMYIYVCLFIFG